MKARASKEQVKARVAEIVRIMLDGAMNLDIEDFVRENEKNPESVWFVPEGEEPLGYSQIRRYVEKAERLIGETCRTDRKKLLNRHLAQRRRLYAAAVSQGDVRAALSVLQDEAELLGLYPARRKEITGKDGEALYPPLSAMVVAVINAEGKLNGEPKKAPLAIFGGNGDERGSAGDATAVIGSQTLP